MTTNNRREKAFTYRLIDVDSRTLLELMNGTDRTLKSVEVLTVFLKDEDTPGGGPSQSNIKFETLKSIQPQERAVLAHRTWVNGRPVDAKQDQLQRLEVVPGQPIPYVLDISWEDAEGKTQYQRIPVGH
jgi:hypothetical protein